MTNHIQAYSVPVVMFAFVYIAWSWHGQKIAGCPPCARKELASYALVSMVMANILCWITVPVILANWYASHTDTTPRIPAEYEYLANLPPVDTDKEASEAAAKRKRLIVVLLILAMVGVFVVFVLPRIAK